MNTYDQKEGSSKQQRMREKKQDLGYGRGKKEYICYDPKEENKEMKINVNVSIKRDKMRRIIP